MDLFTKIKEETDVLVIHELISELQNKYGIICIDFTRTEFSKTEEINKMNCVLENIYTDVKEEMNALYRVYYKLKKEYDKILNVEIKYSAVANPALIAKSCHSINCDFYRENGIIIEF